METQAGLPSSTAPVSVFLVEDSPLIRERLEQLLETITGTRTVGHAESADDAIREILAVHPDVVVLDFQLAGGNGFDVLRAIHRAAPETDVYMLSSFPTEPYRRLAERLGAREFFDKSTEFERVRDALAARVRTAH
jgi:DNA-binding NarL/FixJ family response regulator